jgi:hypothetical protein
VAGITEYDKKKSLFMRKILNAVQELCHFLKEMGRNQNIMNLMLLHYAFGRREIIQPVKLLDLGWTA